MLTTSCCSIAVGQKLADYTHRLLGQGMLDGDTIPTIASWDFRHYPAPTSTCTWTLNGTMVRVTTACTRDDDCFTEEACSRCVAGRCRPLPVCRYDPFR